MECNCKDWKENIEIVNGPTLTEQARNPHLDNEYKGKIFVYCPWCGELLKQGVLMKQEQVDRFLDWIQEYRKTFTPEAMDTGSGYMYMMRKLDVESGILMTITFEKKD